MTADNWFIDVKLRVTGRGRIGADGMVNEFVFLLIQIERLVLEKSCFVFFCSNQLTVNKDNTNPRSTYLFKLDLLIQIYSMIHFCFRLSGLQNKLVLKVQYLV